MLAQAISYLPKRYSMKVVTKTNARLNNGLHRFDSSFFIVAVHASAW